MKRSGEESRRKIIQVAKELFLEKGYDNTSISDIVSGLGGMTKGVVYHHFSSKQDIFDAVLTSYSEGKIDSLSLLGETGFEKLRNLLYQDLKNLDKQAIGYTGRVFLLTPRKIGEQYLSLYEESIPLVEKLILEGISDGSIQTEYPRELAELFMLTSNFLIGLQLGNLKEEDAIRKIHFFKWTLDSLGLPLFDQDFLYQSENLIHYLKKK